MSIEEKVTINSTIASALLGWVKKNPELTLGAILGVLLNDEVDCSICGSGKAAFVSVNIHGTTLMDKADEIASFILDLKNEDGEFLYDRVFVNVKGFLHRTR